MVRPAKGSKEAKDMMAKMRAMRGGAKISRPNVEKMKPEPAKVKGGKVPPPPSRMYGGKIPAPPSRSYDTASEDNIDGIMINGGALNDCPTCCGMGIVKIKGKGTGSSKIKPTEEKQYDYLKYKNDPAKFHKRTNKLLRDNELFMSCLNKMNTGKTNEITPEEIKAYNTS